MAARSSPERGNGDEIGALGVDALGKAAVAAGAQALDGGQAELVSESAHGLQRRRTAEDEGRLGIGKEIFELGQRIGDIERQQRGAGAMAGEQQHDHIGRFVDLHRDPVAGLDAEREKRIGGAPRARE